MGPSTFRSVQGFLNSSERLGNGTMVAQLPTTLLEAFIPGYGLISKFILDAFGFDVSIVVSFGVLVSAGFYIISYVWRRLWNFFLDHLTSSVYVDDSDDLFDSVLNWIGEQRMSQVSRSVKAVTRFHHTSNSEDEDEDQGATDDETGIFNFGRWAAKTPPRYEPYFGRHHFWHERALFLFDRSRREVQVSPWSGRTGDEQLIKLTCIGRSTTPIRHLLNDIKLWGLKREKSLTNIRRPASKEYTRRSGAWDRVTSRPSRPMDTISLDAKQKERIIADVNEYLHPSSPHWYSTRGIPWRRGYLFHGAPGTGKSSLCFALAGLFGLDIYVISLLDPTLTEGDLMRLFNNLPRRCIVLLEDIDSAGLIRDEKSDEVNGTDKQQETDDKISAVELAKAIKSANKRDKRSDNEEKGISLSGLLNAIDGVASHEGRVLVMTTNHPEKLDSALIRPGRVDMQVAFTLATKVQAIDIFVRMYSDMRVGAARSSLNGLLTSEKFLTDGISNGHLKENGQTRNDVSHINATHEVIGRDELLKLAEKFAAGMPEHTFSPAEIQGFLLMRKKEPYKAVEEVETWMNAVLEAREKKSKVVKVQ